MQNISGGRRSRVHENVERGVLGEERDLSLDIPSIGAMGIGVDQFTDRETVGRVQPYPIRLLNWFVSK
jgi:hypothetical protein